MNIFGKEINSRMAIWFSLQGLIIIDIVLITIAMFFDLPSDIATGIIFFDSCVCIILLTEWAINFYLSNPKRIFLKQKSNWISLIASIPLDALLPAAIPGAIFVRYLRLIKLLRIIALFNVFFDHLNVFIKKTNMDKILGAVLFTILLFTLLLYIYGPTNNLFDDFYFVIVTLATVGYGDVVPVTFNEKVISLLLIFIGIFVFSTITAAISSYFTDRLLSSDEEKIEKSVENVVEKNIESVLEELKVVREENKQLRDELSELKELIKK